MQTKAYRVIFLISQPKQMLWELKRTVSLRQFSWAPTIYVKIDGLENIYNFKLKKFCLSKIVVRAFLYIHALCMLSVKALAAHQRN